MSAITELQDLLHHKILVDGFKLPAYAEPAQFKGNNWIAIFYNDDNTTNVRALHLGKTTAIGFYVTPIKVTVRHNIYNKAREATFDVLEFLSVNRNGLASAFIQTIPNQAPTFVGIDESGGNLWNIEINLIGGK